MTGLLSLADLLSTYSWGFTGSISSAGFTS